MEIYIFGLFYACSARKNFKEVVKKSIQMTFPQIKA